MDCIKCGRESDQTFCPACRAKMAEYPIKPGTMVLLPSHRNDARRTPRKKAPPSAEEQVEALKKSIQGYRRAIAALLLLIVLMAAGGWFFYRRSKIPPTGQNYSTVTQPTSEPAEKSA